MDDRLLEHLKAIDTLEVAAWLGIESARQSHKYVCPFCHKPKLNINMRKGQGACCYYAACPGPEVRVYDNVCLVQSVYGVDFKEACELLARQFGLAEGELPKSPPKPKVRVATGHTVRDERITSLLRYLYNRIELGEQGRAYLESRGIPGDAGEWVGIRSIEDSSHWESLVLGLSPDERAACGLLYKGDRIAPAHAPTLVIPYFDASGQLDSFRFRHIDGWSRYMSLAGNNPDWPFLHKAVELAKQLGQPLYVTEAELDALSMIVSDHCALSACGAGTWRAEWVESWHGLEDVIVVADADESGKAFALTVLKSCARIHGTPWAKSHVRVMQCPPRAKDPNALLQRGVLPSLLDGQSVWADRREGGASAANDEQEHETGRGVM